MIQNILFDFDCCFLQQEAIEFLIELGLRKFDVAEQQFRLESLRSLAARTEAHEVSRGHKMNQQLQISQINQADVKRAASLMETQLLPEVQMVINYLKENNRQIIVFSRGFEELVLPVTDLLEIPRRNVFSNRLLFEAGSEIPGIDDSNPLFLQSGKVYLAEYLKNQGRLLGPTAVIGDSRADLSIRKSGIANYFIYFENLRTDETTLSEADFVIQQLDQLLPLVTSPFLTNQRKSPAPRDKETKKYHTILVENIHPIATSKLKEADFSIQSYKHAPDAGELALLTSICNVLGIRSKTQLRAEILEKMQHLFVIGCFCIGTDQVDLEAAARHGIPVFNAPYANTRSVAELVAGMAIMLMRDVVDKSNAAHQGQWLKKTTHACELRGKTVGIIGYGHIGSQVSILFEDLGLKIIYYDIVDKLPLGNARRMPSLEVLLAEADIVTLHVPDTPETRGMINERTGHLMKSGSILINTSRGKVVDLNVLKSAIKSGRIIGAALDVFPEEPGSNQDPFVCELQNLPNVILTPHIGGSTLEAQERIADEVSTKLINFLKTGATIGAVNFPEADLPPTSDSYRILHIHRNQPQVLAKIHNIFSQYQVNVTAEILKTRDSIGYLIVDIHRDNPAPVPELLSRITETIRVLKID
ncbi:phosphoglycerate dehydrogenase [candidate division KSB1 bacterium]|nr:phosphoglycerate dehydrogenase [candidate division KSB1 bacterium]